MKGCYFTYLLIILSLDSAFSSFLPELEQALQKNIPDDNQDSHGTEATNQLEELFRKHDYQLNLRPTIGEPTKVGLNVIIESITDISEKNMDITFTLCVYQTWIDKRLTFNSMDSKSAIVLPSKLIDKIWVPDLYIVGSKKSFVHTTTVDNVVVRLFSDGTLYHTLKITTTVACPMSLYNFPLDTENCSLIFQSLGYNSNELTLHWLNSHLTPLFLDVKLIDAMPKYQIHHFIFHSTIINWTEMPTIAETSKSRLRISFELQRYPQAIFFQSYFPAQAMVLLAALGMWIDPRSAPARVALGITSVLTISTIITGMKASLPKVSYLTALDIYLWTCFLFVFSTVLEFCVLNYWMKKEEFENAKAAQPPPSTSVIGVWLTGKFHCLRNEAADLDIVFRIIYLATFAMFNIVYWTYYCIVTKEDN